MRTVGLLLVAVLLLSCEPGLSPPPDIEPGCGGTIVFEKGTWPRADSLFNLWVFASQTYPLDSTKVFEGMFSNPPTIYLYPSIDQNLPFFVDSVSYAFPLPPASYRYIGVLQRFADQISVRSLRVVGVYGTKSDPPLPIPVVVTEFQFIRGININVNFHKLPPQPF